MEPRATNNCIYCLLCSDCGTNTTAEQEKGKEEEINNKMCILK